MFELEGHSRSIPVIVCSSLLCSTGPEVDQVVVPIIDKRIETVFDKFIDLFLGLVHKASVPQ